MRPRMITALIVAAFALPALAQKQGPAPDAAKDPPACYTNNGCKDKTGTAACYACCAAHCSEQQDPDHAGDLLDCQDACDSRYFRYPRYPTYRAMPSDSAAVVLNALVDDPWLAGDAEYAALDYWYAAAEEYIGRYAIIVQGDLYSVSGEWREVIYANIKYGLNHWERGDGYVTSSISAAKLAGLLDPLWWDIYRIATAHPNDDVRHIALKALIQPH